MCGKVSLILFLLSEIFSRIEANYCGQEVYDGMNGTIKTNPGSSDNSSCLWTVYPPYNRITTIRILQADLHKCSPKHSCCLSITNADSNKNYIKLCNEAPKIPIILSVRGNKTILLLEAYRKIDTRIMFFTRDSSECHNSEFQCYDKTGCYNSTDNCNGDFICSDHSDKVDCGKCQINFTLCDLKSKKCFDPTSQRCDGIIQCPKGEDELDCSDLCPNLIKCPKEVKCIKQDQICNKEIDCGDGFDEKGCLITESSSIYFTLIFIISSLCLMCFLCIVFQWIATRRSSRRFLNNPPDFPLAPFEGPGDQDHESSSSEMFTDSEFRQGGGIYESYLQTIKKSKPLQPIQSNMNRQLSYMDLDGDNELIVLASLNVPVDMCVGLNLPSEKTNLVEVLTQERLQSISKTDARENQHVSATSSRHTEILCVNENPRKSNRCSKTNSQQTFVGSNSSEWTDIEDESGSSSRIIFVKSAEKNQVIS